MTYATLKKTLAALHAKEHFFLPYDQMVDLGLRDEQEVDRATWDVYYWETADSAMLDDLDLTSTTTVLPRGFEWEELELTDGSTRFVVRQVNVASPKPDWSVLVAHQVKP